MKAIIFDLDGVLVETDNLHYKAWKKIADIIGFNFNPSINDKLRGVDRISSLKLILPENHRYSEREIENFASIKNEYYKNSLSNITPNDLLPGVAELLEELKKRAIKKAVASASKNAFTVLENLEIHNCFETIVTGNDVINGKPNPEIFLLAANNLGTPAENCVVIEDSQVGIDAANSASMTSVALDKRAILERADITISSLNNFLVNFS